MPLTSQEGVDSGRGQNRTPRGKVPVEHAIDGPLANGAALLRQYRLSDDDIGQIRARGITGWLSRSSCAFRFTPWVANIMLTGEYWWPKRGGSGRTARGSCRCRAD